jgi:transposase
MKPSADQRHAARQERSKSIIDAFEAWLAQSHAGVSAKSPTGEVSD